MAKAAIEEGEKMAKRSKRWREGRASVDCDKRYSVSEAVDLLLTTPGAKFDESVDAAIRLGVDPRHADQMVRGAVALPHGTGTVSYTHLTLPTIYTV